MLPLPALLALPKPTGSKTSIAFSVVLCVHLRRRVPPSPGLTYDFSQSWPCEKEQDRNLAPNGIDWSPDIADETVGMFSKKLSLIAVEIRVDD